MSKKKKRSVPVAPPKQEKKMVIDMNTINLKKEHTVPGFRTGKHMTEKDRPRKKDWKREYYKSKEPGRYRDDIGLRGITEPARLRKKCSKRRHTQWYLR